MGASRPSHQSPSSVGRRFRTPHRANPSTPRTTRKIEVIGDPEEVVGLGAPRVADVGFIASILARLRKTTGGCPIGGASRVVRVSAIEPAHPWEIRCRRNTCS
jgi:hypothetical protein